MEQFPCPTTVSNSWISKMSLGKEYFSCPSTVTNQNQAFNFLAARNPGHPMTQCNYFRVTKKVTVHINGLNKTDYIYNINVH